MLLLVLCWPAEGWRVLACGHASCKCDAREEGVMYCRDGGDRQEFWDLWEPAAAIVVNAAAAGPGMFPAQVCRWHCLMASGQAWYLLGSLQEHGVRSEGLQH
jgi:hypothetical protein